jgi:PEP-CTERM motif
MKNRSALLSIAILSASLLVQTGAFAANILIDESNFQVPTNQVLVGEWNALGAQATGFAPASLTIVTANETLAALGVVDIHGEWVAPAPFANGQAQTYRFNIWDDVIGGVPTNLSDTLILTLTGQQANPNNMTIDLSFRSDNLAENGLTPMSGAIDIIEDGTFQPLDTWLPSQLTLLNVSFRSDIPEPSSLALLAVGALSLLCASRKRGVAA